jgi:hypothetical protein
MPNNIDKLSDKQIVKAALAAMKKEMHNENHHFQVYTLDEMKEATIIVKMANGLYAVMDGVDVGYTFEITELPMDKISKKTKEYCLTAFKNNEIAAIVR